MFFRLFNTNHPAVFLYLLIYAFLIKGSFFFLPNIYSFEVPGLLADPLFDGLRTFGPGWQVMIHLLSILMVYAQAIAFNQFLIIDRIIQVQNYIPALIFLTLSSLHPEIITLSPTNLAYLFVIPVFYYMFQLPYIQEMAVEVVFYAGLFIGMVSLLYFPTFYLLIPFLIAIIWLRSFHMRELLMPIFGFIMPYFILGVYMIVTDQLKWYGERLSELAPSFSGIQLENSALIAMMGLLMILTLMGFTKTYRLPRQNIILYRNLLWVLLIFILVGIAYLVFLAEEQLLFGYLLLLPISLFISSLYDVEQPGASLKWIFWLMVLLSLFFQFEYYLKTQGLTVAKWLETI